MFVQHPPFQNFQLFMKKSAFYPKQIKLIFFYHFLSPLVTSSSASVLCWLWSRAAREHCSEICYRITYFITIPPLAKTFTFWAHPMVFRQKKSSSRGEYGKFQSMAFITFCAKATWVESSIIIGLSTPTPPQPPTYPPVRASSELQLQLQLQLQWQLHLQLLLTTWFELGTTQPQLVSIC